MQGGQPVTQTLGKSVRAGITVPELLDVLWLYAVNHDDYPTRAELHKQHRGVLPVVHKAMILRCVDEVRDCDGSTTLRITQKGYDLLRQADQDDQDGGVAL